MKLICLPLLACVFWAGGLGCQKQTAVPDSPVAVKTDDPALKAYSKKLAPIVKARILASREWESALLNLPKDATLEKAADVTDKYAKALDKCERDIKSLTPPASAKKVHDAFEKLFRRLGANLDATVAAMRSEVEENLSTLKSERSLISEEGQYDLNLALKDGNFDGPLFAKTGELRVLQ